MTWMHRSGEKTWEIYQKEDDDIESVLLARVVAADDAWYVERPVYQDVGHYFERIPRPYVTSKAAINSVTQFQERAS